MAIIPKPHWPGSRVAERGSMGVWLLVFGEGPSGKGPGWVPGAHQRRPEAQDGRGYRAGPRTAQGGTQLYSAEAYQSTRV